MRVHQVNVHLDECKVVEDLLVLRRPPEFLCSEPGLPSPRISRADGVTVVLWGLYGLTAPRPRCDFHQAAGPLGSLMDGPSLWTHYPEPHRVSGPRKLKVKDASVLSVALDPSLHNVLVHQQRFRREGSGRPQSLWLIGPQICVIADISVAKCRTKCHGGRVNKVSKVPVLNLNPGVSRRAVKVVDGNSASFTV